MMKRLVRSSARGLLLAGSMMAALPAQAATQTIDKHFHQRFDVEPGARLVLDHGDGDVEITPWSDNAIDIDVVYEAEVTRVGPGSTTDFTVTFDQRGDTVKVKGKEPGGVVIGMLRVREIAYVYRIQAPPWMTLILDGDDGSVAIEGWRADLDLDLDDGDLDLEDTRGNATIRAQDGDLRISTFAGKLKVETDDGDVTIRRAEGPSIDVSSEDGQVVIDESSGRFTIKSDDGDIDLRRLRAGRIDITTADGDVTMDVAAADPRLEVEAESDDGSITVVLAKGIGVRFDVRMDDGRVEIDVPGAETDRDEHRVAGQIGDGDGDLRIETNDGDVTIATR